MIHLMIEMMMYDDDNYDDHRNDDDDDVDSGDGSISIIITFGGGSRPVVSFGALTRDSIYKT